MMNKQIGNQYLEETLSLKNNLEKNFLHLGSRLLKIRDEQLFLSTHTSFVEFLWEMKMTESTASKMINIYTLFLRDLELDESLLLEAGGWTTVYKVKDMVKDKDTALEWLHKAKTLSPKDLDIVIREAKSGKKQDDCQHEKTYMVKICEDCNQRVKVYPEELAENEE